MKRQRYTREDILCAARELAEEFGEQLTHTLFTRETGISQSVVCRHFGKWSALRLAVGLKKRPPLEAPTRSITRGELIDRLKRLAAEEGGEVTLHEFCRRCGYGPASVYRHFGTWSRLRREAGLTPRFRMPRTYSDDELFQELVRIVRLLNKYPTNSDISKFSRFSISTYLRRFGNKRALRRAFGAWLLAQQRGDPDSLHNLTRWDRTDEIPPNDPWLLWLWTNVRITFLPRSSHLQRYRKKWPELLICEIHDWPQAPCPVHQISDLLKHRLHELKAKSKTGPKPRPWF